MNSTIAEKWNEEFAWWPVRSTWSRKLIWFKKYYSCSVTYYNRKKIVKHKFIYTPREYIMTVLINDENEF